MIKNRLFQKFKIEEFITHSDIKKTELFFESFNDGNYRLLKKNLETFHNID